VIFWGIFFPMFTIGKMQFFDFHYFPYNPLYSLTVKNAKNPSIFKKIILIFLRLKLPQINVFLSYFAISDPNRSFWGIVKIPKNAQNGENYIFLTIFNAVLKN